MEEDNPQSNNSSSNNSGRGRASGGGGGGLGGGLIQALLPILFKNPKLLLIVAVIGGGLYFFMGKGCNIPGNIASSAISNFVRGGELNKDVYEQTEIYEPLADNVKNPLPERVNLQKYCPTPLNQGQQGSCVAWASAYAARTIIESQRTGQSPNEVKFSPAFMYNQISLDHNTCQGSYIKLAMDNMMNIGAVPFNDFKYTDQDCEKEPSSGLKAEAEAFKIKGFQRLTEEKNGKAYEAIAMKQNLAKGSPCIIGMMAGGSFMQDMLGQELWTPTGADYDQSGFGGHAMCVVGYDDYYEGGAFLLMNSWGTDWGKNGFAWIRYSDFKEFNIEAYGLYPMGNADNKVVSVFEGSFGLQLNDGKKTIGLEKISENYFETTTKLKRGDKFKVEFTNNVECYTYIFGEETDGSSYVLFPYTPKHSPYCGITGTRLFPRDYSMTPDNKGQIDKIAVVITHKPLDYNALNKKISTASASTYEAKLNQALNGNNFNVTYSGNQSINFKTDASNKEAFGFLVGVK